MSFRTESKNDMNERGKFLKTSEPQRRRFIKNFSEILLIGLFNFCPSKQPESRQRAIDNLPAVLRRRRKRRSESGDVGIGKCDAARRAVVRGYRRELRILHQQPQLRIHRDTDALN